MYYASLLVVDNNCKHLCQFEGQTSMLWRRGLQFSRVSRRILQNFAKFCFSRPTYFWSELKL